MQIKGLKSNRDLIIKKPYLIKEQGMNNVSYSFITPKFFIQSKTNRTEKMFHHLNRFAETIEEPEIYGKFNNEKHFIDTLYLAQNCTDEARHAGIIYLRNLVGQIKKKGNLLEIGPGNGEFLSWFGGRFSHVTVIDNNSIVLANVLEKFSQKHVNTNITLKNTPLETASFPKDYFDLINLSHVLYYIDNNLWFEVVSKLFSALKPNGILAICLSGDKNGKANFIQNFHGIPIQTDILVTYMANHFPAKIEVIECHEFFYTTSLLAILHTLGFILADAHITQKKDILLDYIEDNIKADDSNYYLSSQQKIIFVKKLA